ncbi:MAG TPA: DUF4157 domain-containing protein, partial [bacterium]|nr:DUF4157 domain-containing protein [bacterium]
MGKQVLQIQNDEPVEARTESPGKAPATPMYAGKHPIQLQKISVSGFSDSVPLTPPNLLFFQHTVGNQEVNRLVRRQMRIGHPGDVYEREADRVAEQLVCSDCSSPQVREAGDYQKWTDIPGNRQTAQRQSIDPSPLQEAADDELRRRAEGEAAIQGKQKAGGGQMAGRSFERQLTALHSGGEALSDAERNYFEPRFNMNFSEVRIHSRPQANAMAKPVHARAFTTGPDIVFGSGEYAPESAGGRKLLAHELAHVVQQQQMTHSVQRQESTASATQTPEELISSYTSWGNLDESGLGEYLLNLVLKSPASADFVKQVRDELGDTDRDDVAFYFIQAATDSLLQSLATASGGRSLLTMLRNDMATGWVTSEEIEQVGRIDKATEKIEKEISETELEMMEVAATPFTINVYPGGTPIDAAEITMPAIAKKRPGTAVGVKSLKELLEWI